MIVLDNVEATTALLERESSKYSGRCVVYLSFPGDYQCLLRASYETFVLALEPGAFLVDMLPILKAMPDWIPFAGLRLCW